MTEKNNVIKWGIIGCGDVCEVKSGPGLQQARGSKLAAVMRRNAHLAEDFARRHGVPRWYDDADELINDHDIDCVYVATPPSSHKEYALRVLSAKKPVYVEKPMAMNFSECTEMIMSSEKHAVPLFVAYYRRALPRFLSIKKLIDEKRIGTIRFVNTVLNRKILAKDLKGNENWRTNPAIAGGGYFYDLAPHTLDILQFFLGDIISAQGSVFNQAGLYDAEDTVKATYLFPNEIQGTGFWCFCAGKNEDYTEIIGEEGKITFATFGNTHIILETKIKKTEIDRPNPVTIQQPLIQTIVDELRGKGTCPSTGYTASRTSWVIDQIFTQ